MENTDFLKEDASLSAEYWETFAQKRGLRPEKRLLIAVLEDAVKNYRKLVFTGGRRFAEEKAWIFSDDNKDTFSFRNICDVLGLSPSGIRQSLSTWTTTGALSRPVEKLQIPQRHLVSRRDKKTAIGHAAARQNPAGCATV